ncbi:RNA polymerase sigma factor [Salinicoccus albus]|uniref:RNA polymerase sigma factor n=1 Tax=Salinicoccus albus TaxID=418756 RepID=UPI0003662579|nr:sigma-70 family RNA polymerase sigma factor [Salinicoccus albus]
MASTDSELYDGLLAGDKSCLERLYRKYEKLLYSYAYKMTSSHEKSEEVVQDVFMKLWQKKGAYDAAKGKMSTWLITLTRNAVIDLSRRKQLDTFEYDERDDVDNETNPFNSTVEKTAEKHEDQKTIAHAVKSLNDEQQRIVTLFYFKAYSQSQIAAALDLPVGTVKSRLRLALGHLKKNIERSEKGGTHDE